MTHLPDGKAPPGDRVAKTGPSLHPIKSPIRSCAYIALEIIDDQVPGVKGYHLHHLNLPNLFAEYPILALHWSGLLIVNGREVVKDGQASYPRQEA